jgi:hypothetical protein
LVTVRSQLLTNDDSVSVGARMLAVVASSVSTGEESGSSDGVHWATMTEKACVTRLARHFAAAYRPGTHPHGRRPAGMPGLLRWARHVSG